MNTGFYNNLDTNFEQAYQLCERDFSHEELVQMLNSGNIPQKQIAALKFDKVESKDDAITLLNNLTGCDGKIREAVALKIYQTLKNTPHSAVFFTQDTSKIFADATIDINGNICRLIVDSVNILKSDKNFAQTYTQSILDFAKDALDELDKFIYRDKKYVINKQIFKLYWCLETLKNFYYIADDNILIPILESCSKISEYTIREKVAQIATLNNRFASFKEILKNDDNYYVKAALLNH